MEKPIDLENGAKLRLVAPAGCGLACAAANDCWLYKRHIGKHQNWRGNEW